MRTLRSLFLLDSPTKSSTTYPDCFTNKIRNLRIIMLDFSPSISASFQKDWRHVRWIYTNYQQKGLFWKFTEEKT